MRALPLCGNVRALPTAPTKKRGFCFCKKLFEGGEFTLFGLSRKFAATGLPKIATE